MGHINYWRRARGDRETFEPHKDKIQRLVNGETQGLGVEKLKGNPRYPRFTMEIDDDRRILFMVDKGEIVLLKVITRHQHARHVEIKKTDKEVLEAFGLSAGLDDLVWSIEVDEEEDAQAALREALGPQPHNQGGEALAMRAFAPQKQGNIRFGVQQEAVLDMTSAAIVYGPPGSGKTLTAIQMLLEYVREQSQEDAPWAYEVGASLADKKRASPTEYAGFSLADDERASSPEDEGVFSSKGEISPVSEEEGASAILDASASPILEEATPKAYEKHAFPVVYVTRTKELRDKVQEEWLAVCTDPTHQNKVLFKTYDELLREQLGLGVEFADDNVLFTPWLKKQKKSAARLKKASSEATPDIFSKLTPQEVWAEFRIRSGYSEEEYKSPERVGKKTLDAAAKEQICRLYTAYVAHLSAKHLVSPILHSVPRDPRYRRVLVDEAQDFSYGQLRNLRGWAYDEGIVFFLGDHQVLFDGTSRFPYLKELFFKENTPFSLIELPVSYRNSPAVLRLINQLIKLKFNACGLETGEVALVTGSDDVVKRETGEASWLDPSNKNYEKALQDLIQEAELCADFVIVTLPEYVEEAKTLFKNKLVLTTEQVKGLEFKKVVAWRLLDTDATAPVSSKLKPLDILLEPKSHEGKEDSDRSMLTYFNEIITAVSRAKESFVFVQRETHANEVLVRNLQTACPIVASSEKRAAYVASTKEEWEALVIQLLDSGRKDLKENAWDVFRVSLHGTKKEFMDFCTRHQENKAAKQVSIKAAAKVVAPVALAEASGPSSVSDKKNSKSVKPSKEIVKPAAVKLLPVKQPAMVKPVIKGTEQIIALLDNFSEERLISCLNDLYVEKYKNSHRHWFMTPVLYKDAKEPQPFVHYLLQSIDKIRIFTDSLMNNPDLVKNIPWDQCLDRLLHAQQVGFPAGDEREMRLGALLLVIFYTDLVQNDVIWEKCQIFFKKMEVRALIGSSRDIQNSLLYWVSKFEQGKLFILDSIERDMLMMNDIFDVLPWPCQTGPIEELDRSALYWLTDSTTSTTGIKVLLKLLEKKPVFITALPAQMWILSQTDTSTMELGACPLSNLLNSDEGQNFLEQLLRNIGSTEITDLQWRLVFDFTLQTYCNSISMRTSGVGNLGQDCFLLHLEKHPLLFKKLKLLKLDPDKPQLQGNTLTCTAAEQDNGDLIRILYALGADLNYINMGAEGLGRTAVSAAVESNNFNALRVLDELRADLNKPDCYGSTPMHSAVTWNRETMILWLKAAGVRLDTVDHYGKNLLHCAVVQDYDHLIQTLLEWGIDAHQEAKNGRSPVFEAALACKNKILEQFHKHGCELSKKQKIAPSALIDYYAIAPPKIRDWMRARINSQDKDNEGMIFVSPLELIRWVREDCTERLDSSRRPSPVSELSMFTAAPVTPVIVKPVNVAPEKIIALLDDFSEKRLIGYIKALYVEAYQDTKEHWFMTPVLYQDPKDPLLYQNIKEPQPLLGYILLSLEKIRIFTDTLMANPDLFKKIPWIQCLDNLLSAKLELEGQMRLGGLIQVGITTELIDNRGLETQYSKFILQCQDGMSPIEISNVQITLLYWLSKFALGKEWLLCAIDTDFFDENKVLLALLLPCLSEPKEAVLYRFTQSEDGVAVLIKLLEKKPFYISDIADGLWVTSPNILPETAVGSSPLSNLLRTDYGQDFLEQALQEKQINNISEAHWRQAFDFTLRNYFLSLKGEATKLKEDSFLTSLEWHPHLFEKLTSLSLKPDEPKVEGRTLACQATVMEAPKLLRILHALGADLDYENEKFYEGTPVFLAASYASLDMLTVLKELGASLVKECRSGYTPVEWAVVNGNYSVIRHLMDLGVDIKNNGKYNYLHLAAAFKQFHLIKPLLNWGVDVNKISNEGINPIFEAALSCNFEALDEFKAFGCDLMQSIKLERKILLDFYQDSPRKSKMHAKIKKCPIDSAGKISVSAYDVVGWACDRDAINRLNRSTTPGSASFDPAVSAVSGLSMFAQTLVDDLLFSEDAAVQSSSSQTELSNTSKT